VDIQVLQATKKKKMNIKEYSKTIEDFAKIKRNERTLTFMEICKYPGSRFEEVCSRILKFYFTPTNDHGLSELLISTLVEILEPNSNYNLNEIKIELEEYAAKKRIDILIEGNSFVIGVENKINAKLYNDISIYRKKIEAYKKPLKSTFGVILTLRKLSEDERLIAVNNNFKVISYKEFFQKLKGKLSAIQDKNKYIIYLFDFIKTIENLTHHDMTKEQNNFFKEKSEIIDKLIVDYSEYKNQISKKQKERVASLYKKIKEERSGNWWVYREIDLGIQMNLNEFEIGLESWFVENESSPVAEYKIMITTWSRKNWDYFQEKVMDEIGKGKAYKSGSKTHLDFKIIDNGSDNEIIEELKNAFDFIEKIVKEKESSL
jgi:hypothetical protein